MLNAGPHVQCRAVRSMQGRTFNSGGVRSMQSRMLNAGPQLNAGPYVQCKAVLYSMQGRTFNTGPYVQCRAVRSMQGRTFNAGPYVQCRAVRLMQGRTFTAERHVLHWRQHRRRVLFTVHGCARKVTRWDAVAAPLLRQLFRRKFEILNEGEIGFW